MGNSFKDNKAGYDQFFTQFKPGKGESAVFVGFLKSSGTHKSKDGGKGSLTVAQLAAVHEFGSADGRIPERSFMRSAVFQHDSKIKALQDKLFNMVIVGAMGKRKALAILGDFVASAMKNKIRDGVPPPNTKETIRRKKSSKTLIDTGQLLNSIEFQVVDGKGKV